MGQTYPIAASPAIDRSGSAEEQIGGTMLTPTFPGRVGLDLPRATVMAA